MIEQVSGPSSWFDYAHDESELRCHPVVVETQLRPPCQQTTEIGFTVTLSAVEALLRVQFDDQLLLDVLGNGVTLGVGDEGTCEGAGVEIEPAELRVLLTYERGNGRVVLRLLFQRNNVAGFELERRN